MLVGVGIVGLAVVWIAAMAIAEDKTLAGAVMVLVTIGAVVLLSV